MTQTDPDLTINEKRYPTIAGYLQISPIVNQHKAENQDAKIRRVNDWFKSNKKFVESHSEDLRDGPAVLTILGSKEVQGTYFHPSIFISALQWACPSFG